MSIRMRHTRGHTNNRRSHHALTATTVIKDKESGNARLPHRLDEETGMYRGKQIAPARVVKATKKDAAKGPVTTPVALGFVTLGSVNSLTTHSEPMNDTLTRCLSVLSFEDVQEVQSSVWEEFRPPVQTGMP